ncbi:MAG TPA: phosphate ABC transporter permease PstA [Candidatus Limnocylindrales bacterium]|nr:phosphate ABC transporter permease PstA [Candidatus Limnocylindrales bacterium]
MSALTTPATGSVPRFDPRIAKRRMTGTIFLGACIAAIGILLIALVALLVDVVSKGVPWLDIDFLTGVPSRRAATAGILPALVGSLEISLLTGLISVPVGVGAAIYLQEYARDTFLTRTLRTNIANLAGVPSIIYGIFGLAIFVRALSLGRSPLAAALTLALLIMPIVIIATIEALRAVPDSQREGAYALGATRWQTVRGSVLPAAAPGIVTGVILAIARAIGEAAPLIVIGASAFLVFLPTPLQQGFSVLPIQVFQWSSRPQADFQGIAAATILVMLFLTAVLNVVAIVVRNRLARNIQW